MQMQNGWCGSVKSSALCEHSGFTKLTVRRPAPRDLPARPVTPLWVLVLRPALPGWHLVLCQGAGAKGAEKRGSWPRAPGRRALSPALRHLGPQTLRVAGERGAGAVPSKLRRAWAQAQTGRTAREEGDRELCSLRCSSAILCRATVTCSAAVHGRLRGFPSALSSEAGTRTRPLLGSTCSSAGASGGLSLRASAPNEPGPCTLS